MKKKDGYVIIYVVFVVLFLCIVAVGSCTSALNNLKIQNASIHQMQDRYKAEGDIEQYMAEVCVAGEKVNSNGHLYLTAADAKGYAKLDFSNLVNSSGSITCDKTAGWVDGGIEYQVTLETSCGSTRIIAVVAFRANIAANEHTVTVMVDGEEKEDTQYGYEITDVTSKYLSYTLESTGGGSE